MQYTTLLFALLFVAIFMSSCVMSRFEDRSGNPIFFTSSGALNQPLRQDTLPVIIVLDQPLQYFDYELTENLRDSLQSYGIVPKFEVYGPVSLSLVEDELPRIQQYQQSYLWIQTDDHYQVEQPLNTEIDRFFVTFYNVRLYQNNKILWRANSMSSLGFEPPLAASIGRPADIMVHYLTKIMHKDGLLSKKSSVITQ
jgi:hypothetical protein